ncbi:MAG TPA: helix-turn-helix domain-containing protein [Acidimicrobiia bacterium]|nr:helix-turn-helix domain-containing protein [Acidimicrobiia bacterium]
MTVAAAGTARPTGEVQALLDLAVVMAESDDVDAIVELAAAAVPTLAPATCLGLRSPSEPEPPGDPEPDAGTGTVEYPVRTTSLDHGVLVVAAERSLTPEEDRLLRLLAQQTAVALSGARRMAAHRKDAYELARANVALSRLVDELRRTVEIHARLDGVATSGAGPEALAATLHAVTGFPVAVEDGYGNLQASAPGEPPTAGIAAGRQDREQIIRTLLRTRKATRVGPWIAVLAAPRYDVVGLLSLYDPDGAAGKFELLALEHGATVLAVELARLSSVVEAEQRVGRDLLEDLVTGRDQRSALPRAQAFGFDLNRPHRIAVAWPATDVPGEAALSAARRAARETGVDLIAAGRPDGVLLLATGDPPWERFRLALDADSSDAGGTPIRWRLALGGPCRAPADAPRSYREALLTRALQRSPSAAPVLAWESLGVYRILSSLDDVGALERLVTEQLGPLLDHDAERGSQLVETLHHYLESGGSPAMTAKALFVHASTVKYRLTRIRDVGGYDLSQPSTRFALQLATQAWQVLSALREVVPASP